MPTSVSRPRPAGRWSLPDNPSLEWLRGRARELQRAARDDAAEEHGTAVDLIEVYDPPLDDLADLPLARAQRVLARAFGFDGWPTLRAHLDRIAAFTRRPEPHGEDDSPAERLLRLGCLPYTDRDAHDIERAADLLRTDPELAQASVSTLAFAGRAEQLAGRLAAEPGLVNADQPPHAWSPILYLCYGRLGLADADLAGDPVATLQVLLDAGADPNAGFLWHGLTSPFTALTGVLGGGERGEPAHPQAVALAELLLEAGADPNDNQALYNRMFEPADDHLPPLLAHGLGSELPSPWRDRFGDAYPSAAEMIGEHLRSAAERGFTHRVRLLLDHGVDPNTPGYHPILGDQTAYEVAVRRGQRACAEMLAAAGGRSERLDELDRLAYAALSGVALSSAALSGEALSGTALSGTALSDVALSDGPKIAARLVRRRPELMAIAAEFHGVAALQALLDLGFAVDAADRSGRTALHQAALDGDEAVCDWLLAHGADPQVRDRRFDSTPAGWAEHNGHRELAERLA